MGWSFPRARPWSPAFTIAVYQHAWQEGPYEAAAALEKAFASDLSGVGNPLANKIIEAAEQRVSTANWQVTEVGRQGIEP